ncbi:hypothetical protein ACP275_10G116000 [Erythranthe tilingii]
MHLIPKTNYILIYAFYICCHSNTYDCSFLTGNSHWTLEDMAKSISSMNIVAPPLKSNAAQRLNDASSYKYEE